MLQEAENDCGTCTHTKLESLMILWLFEHTGKLTMVNTLAEDTNNLAKCSKKYLTSSFFRFQHAT